MVLRELGDEHEDCDIYESLMKEIDDLVENERGLGLSDLEGI